METTVAIQSKWPGHGVSTIANGDQYLKDWNEVFSVKTVYVKDAMFYGRRMGNLFSKRRYQFMRFRNVSFFSVDLEDCDFEHCVFEGCYFGLTDYQKRMIFQLCWFELCVFDAIGIRRRGGKVEIDSCEFVDCTFKSLDIFTGSMDITHTNFNNVVVQSSFNNNVIFRQKCNGVIDAGRDRRGYHFFGFWHENQWKVTAGCRWFTKQEAMRHWKDKGNVDALARVRLIMGSAKPVFSEIIRYALVAEATP